MSAQRQDCLKPRQRTPISTEQEIGWGPQPIRTLWSEECFYLPGVEFGFQDRVSGILLTTEQNEQLCHYTGHFYSAVELYKTLGRHHIWAERLRKISPPSGFNSRTVQPVASRYTD